MADRESSKEMQILKLVTPYYMAFPSKGMESGGLAVYCRALSVLSLEEIDAAMTKLLRTQKFFPAVSEVFDAVEQLKTFVAAEVGHEKGKLTAAEAWQEVMENVRTNHVYKPWSFTNPEVERAARQFGIQELCSLTVEGVNTARAQYMRMYESAIRQSTEKKMNSETLSLIGREKVAALIADIGVKQIE